MKSKGASEEKKQIYYARTYRHLRVRRLQSVLFLLLFVLPLTGLLLLFYDELTWWMSWIASWVISAAGGPQARIQEGVFLPLLGPIYSLSLPTVQPGYGLILGNLAAALVLIWLLSVGPQKGRPAAVYLSIVLLIHLMACIFFLVGRPAFPYTLEDYSDLYVKQQVGIWIAFLVLMGLVMTILDHGGILRRIVTVLGLMLYSFAFGLARYTLFLGVLSSFSMLYMPVMFFTLGPFFDFLYFVAIYAISTNRMIRLYSSKRKGDWLWA